MGKKIKIIISGGGTGGHIFPAISIANALKELVPDCEILFVGALGRMEMDRVPAAGYDIVGLPVIGFPRKPGIRTIQFFIKLAASIKRARKLVKQFKPDVVVGVGGYASGPVIRVASQMKIPSLIQEQNSYAGITNRMLAKRVNKICVAYDNMDRFFPANKIVYTGNPVRNDLLKALDKTSEAFSFYNLNLAGKVILITGGSLGARTLNESVLSHIELLEKSKVQVIWQTGSFYYDSVIEKTRHMDIPNIHIHKFLSRMDLAYVAANVVISRAGAGTISELCLMKKPCILIPSPNVAEDHQTKNARALSDKNAAILIPDAQAVNELIPQALELIDNAPKMEQLSTQIALLAKPDAAKQIAQIVIDLTKQNDKF